MLQICPIEAAFRTTCRNQDGIIFSRQFDHERLGLIVHYIFRIAAVAAMACIALTKIAPTRAANAEDSAYVIHVVLPQTGGAAFLGAGMTQSLKVLENRVNRVGGIGGRPLKFALHDDATNAQTAVQLMNGALAEKPSVVVDAGPAATCRATMALVTTGPLMYCLTPSIHPTAGSYVFSSSFSSDDILGVSMKYLRDRHLRKIGVLNGTDATGQDADTILSALIKAPENVSAGATFAAYEHYNLSDLSVAAQIARIKAADVQAIIVFTTGTALATVLRAISDAGIDVPIVTSPGNMAYTEMESFKGIVPKQLLFAGPPLFVPDQLTDPGVKKSVIAMNAAFKLDGAPRPDLFSGLAWDGMSMVVDALSKLGPSATAAGLRDYLSGQRNYAGVLGRYDFRAHPQRGLGASSAIMERWSPESDSFVAVSAPGGAPL